MKRGIAALLFCGLVLPALPLVAQVDCNVTTDRDRYGIMMDDVRLSAASDASQVLARLRLLLSTSLQNHLEALGQEPDLPLGYDACPGRYPKPSQFMSDNVNWMNARRVVMEVWGTVSAVDNAYDASLNVAIVPARLIELDLDQPEPPAMFTIKRAVPSTAGTQQMLSIFREYRDLSAYAFVGAGLRSMRENKYDLAAAYLCRGIADLQTLTDPRNQALLKYVISKSKEVNDAARADAGYHGHLKLIAAGSSAGTCK